MCDGSAASRCRRGRGRGRAYRRCGEVRSSSATTWSKATMYEIMEGRWYKSQTSRASRRGRYLRKRKHHKTRTLREGIRGNVYGRKKRSVEEGAGHEGGCDG